MPIEFIRYAVKNLEPKEKILFQTKTHWIILVSPILTMIFGLALWTVVPETDASTLKALSSDPLRHLFETPKLMIFPFAVLITFLGLGMFIKRFLDLIASEMTVTTRRVIDKEGFFWRNANEIDARKLEGSELVNQSWLGQLLDYGSLTLNGVGGKRITLPYAVSPLEMRRQVSRLIAHYDKRQRIERGQQSRSE